MPRPCYVTLHLRTLEATRLRVLAAAVSCLVTCTPLFSRRRLSRRNPTASDDPPWLSVSALRFGPARGNAFFWSNLSRIHGCAMEEEEEEEEEERRRRKRVVSIMERSASWNGKGTISLSRAVMSFLNFLAAWAISCSIAARSCGGCHQKFRRARFEGEEEKQDEFFEHFKNSSQL